MAWPPERHSALRLRPPLASLVLLPSAPGHRPERATRARVRRTVRGSVEHRVISHPARGRRWSQRPLFQNRRRARDGGAQRAARRWTRADRRTFSSAIDASCQLEEANFVRLRELALVL